MNGRTNSRILSSEPCLTLPCYHDSSEACLPPGRPSKEPKGLTPVEDNRQLVERCVCGPKMADIRIFHIKMSL